MERLDACVTEGGTIRLYGCYAGGKPEYMEEMLDRMENVEHIYASTQKVYWWRAPFYWFSDPWADLDVHVHRAPNGDVVVDSPTRGGTGEKEKGK